MNSEFHKELLELLVKHKVIPASVITELRNLDIRAEYKVLKNKIGSRPAMEKLSEEYFTSVGNIDKIVYPRKK